MASCSLKCLGANLTEDKPFLASVNVAVSLHLVVLSFRLVLPGVVVPAEAALVLLVLVVAVVTFPSARSSQMVQNPSEPEVASNGPNSG